MFKYSIVFRKKMKRVILHVKNGEIYVSAPYRTSKKSINDFVISEQDWIKKQLAKPKVIPPKMLEFDDEACLTKFTKLAKNIDALIGHRLKQLPEIRVKNYRSRWGVCYPQRGYIILNKQLFNKPDKAIEQVILHEYVHFLVPNHGPDFHKIMLELMPDYRQRRKLLK